MRIGIDARSLSMPLSGVGRYTHELCTRLVSIGHEIVLYSHREPHNDFQIPHSARFVTPNIRNRLIGGLWYQFCSFQWIRRDDLDLFWGPAHKLPFFLPKTLSKVVTIHDLVWLHAGHTMRWFLCFAESILVPNVLKRASFVITVSDSSKHALLRAFPSIKEKVQRIYPGFSQLPQPLEVEALKTIGVSPPYILFVGTIEPRKNLPSLLDAFARLKQMTVSKVTLVIVGGDGWGNINLQNYLKRLNLENDVFCADHINDGLLATLYSYALFLIMPSVYEGFGLPIIEAMSFGVPAVVGDNSSMPEVAGFAGLTVQAEDIGSIYKGIRTLLEDKEIYERLKKHASNNAHRFSWDTAAKELDSLFIKLKTSA